MEALRLITRTPEPRTWAKVALPSLALAAAAMLDQSTRGPSLATLVLTALFN